MYIDLHICLLRDVQPVKCCVGGVMWCVSVYILAALVTSLSECAGDDDCIKVGCSVDVAAAGMTVAGDGARLWWCGAAADAMMHAH